MRDIPDLIQLLKELFSVEKDFKFDPEKQKNGLELLIKKPATVAHVLVVEDKGQCIGLVTVQFVISTDEGAKSALIEDMVIRKDYRHRGIGSRLLDTMISWCRIRGIVRIQLLADKNNLLALRFYKKRGWQSTQLVGYRKYT